MIFFILFPKNVVTKWARKLFKCLCQGRVTIAKWHKYGLYQPFVTKLILSNKAFVSLFRIKCLCFLFLLFFGKNLFATFSSSPSIEVKTGYFFFLNDTMRKVYDGIGQDVQLCGTYPLTKGIQLYSSLEYLQTKGYSLGDGERTFFWEIPLTIGLKTQIDFSDTVSCYAILGPQYFYLHVHNTSSFVNRNLSTNGIGGLLGVGIDFVFYPHLILDLFGQCSYEKILFHTSRPKVYTKHIQVGGCVVGFGIAYAF